jgi:hypothetical protein
VVLWNAYYLGAIVEDLRAEGFPVHAEDVARLSPLGHCPSGPSRRVAPAGMARNSPARGHRPSLGRTHSANLRIASSDSGARLDS